VESGTTEESEGFLSSTYRAARSTVGLDPPEPPPPSWMPQLSRTERLKGFVICMSISLIFFVLAFVIGLPMVVLAPTKFAISFTLGSISFMLSFAILEGPWDHCKRVFSSERLPFTISYVLTIIGTLYCSLSWRNYLATVLFSGLQITALLWYAATYIPGGTTGMKFLSGLVWSALSNGFVPFCRGITSCCLGGGGDSSS
jgi:hypothetical protein